MVSEKHFSLTSGDAAGVIGSRAPNTLDQLRPKLDGQIGSAVGETSVADVT